jgi:large subunit ribosomal protein L1
MVKVEKLKKTSDESVKKPKTVKPKVKSEKAVDIVEVVETEVLAKAGKRSPKSLAEAKVIEAKKLKTTDDNPEVKVANQKKPNPSRSIVARKGRKYQTAFNIIDRTKTYSLPDAIDLAIKSSPTKFDATTELHVRLGVDPKHADQNIRDNIVLPHGTGKMIRIAVFADDKEVEAARKAGADIALGEVFLEQLDKSLINFDILISTPSMMPQLAKYARILGPKGLMPNPKNGTVTGDTAKAVKEAKAGKVEYKIDSSGIIHLGFGKVSFGKEKLVANAEVVLNSIKSNKPAHIKGSYVLSVFITTTMGPSIKLDNNI